MRAAVIADVHGNLPALRAVLDAAARAGAETHLVLGDLVGYGAAARTSASSSSPASAAR